MKVIRPLPTEKICIQCQIRKSVSEFGTSRHVDSPRGFYYRSYCKPCGNKMSRAYGLANRAKRNERLRQWRASNPSTAQRLDRKKAIRNKYGLLESQVTLMRTEQNGCCRLCGQHKTLVIDHDHQTKRVRGLLCQGCNLGLGWLERQPTGFLKIVSAYLHADVLLELANGKEGT